jgi:hypothetical protein
MIVGMQNSAVMRGYEIGDRRHHALPGQHPRTTEQQNCSFHSRNPSSGAIGNYRIPGTLARTCCTVIHP